MVHLRIGAIFFILITASGNPLLAQSENPRGSNKSPSENLMNFQERRDGYFEVKLKTPGEFILPAEKLVRDRDLNPAALYRVSTGGYLAFDESVWVRDLKFKLEDIRVTELPQYKRFASLLEDLNQKIEAMDNKFQTYDQMALRLVNLCDRSRFENTKEMDQEIRPYLTIYNRLQGLKDQVVHSLVGLAKEQSCRNQFEDYNRILDRYKEDLRILGRDYDSLMRRGLMLTQDNRPSADQSQNIQRTRRR